MKEKIKTDCVHFRGDLPCGPHKSTGVHCPGCRYYKPVKERILLIKLGALGDVLRTTPLLHPLRREYPWAEIDWLTHSPEILSRKYINRILPVTAESLEWLKSGQRFDWLINLDKDPLAISLAESVRARRKSGFGMDRLGRCRPLDASARPKWLTGLWDDVSRQNRKHYIQEIFSLCGFRFQGEEYILEDSCTEQPWKLVKKRPCVGLNTGCGGRWTSRLWPEEYWIDLARKLKKDGLQVVLLGGEAEDKKNKRIASRSQASYFGAHDLKTFIHLVNEMDIVVTAVTMAMHLAIGLRKQLILFNNIFNKHEFYLYNRGVILEPETACDCYYSAECPKECMRSLRVDTVHESVRAMVQRSSGMR